MSATVTRYAAITDKVARIPLRYPHPRNWWICFGFSLLLLFWFFVSVGMLFAYGVGVWGNNIPVNWGLAICNYIWFLGIGHAGTFISALLLLLNAQWRNSLNRFAEAMTLFSVVCAGLYPVLHLGRVWYFYWMAPYPNIMTVWPQFKSPLAWDFFAVLTYLIVSVWFWYIGILPDLATMRDRATTRGWQLFYGLLCLGWRGSVYHWVRWRQAYRLTAVIAIALVVSVTAEYSLIFAAGPVPGWNSTMFPPYFLLGAVFSGFAVVAMIAVVLRHALGLYDLVTERHLDRLAILLLATGMMTAYFYLVDIFDPLYSGDSHDLLVLRDRLFGAYAWSFWGAVGCNFIPLQLLWFRRCRRAPIPLFVIGLLVATGMWLERFMLMVTGMYKEYLTSSFGGYTPSFWEWSLFAGMGGVFLVPFLLFVRLLPIMSISDMKEAEYEEAGHG